MRIVILSYGRADNVITGKWLKGVEILVPESQKADYIKHNPKLKVVSIPDELDGNVAKKRNACLNLYKGENIVTLDDDIRKIGYYDDGEMIEATGDEFKSFCENMFVMAEELGTVLWGLNLQADKKFYREYSPFSFSSVVLGPVQGIRNIDEDRRYSEKMFLKEDYDFSLEVLNKYRKILRNNKWHYVSAHIDNKGGVVSQRNVKLESEHLDMFQKKWGSRIVQKRTETQYGNITINPIVRIPIKGI